jgi:lipoprotein-anchoring transpeptidase ErfK/SrfK
MKQSSADTPEKKGRVRRWVKALLFGIAVFLVLTAGTVSAFAYYYKDRFYPGVHISGIDVSGKKRVDVEAVIKAKAALYRAHTVVVTIPDYTKQPVVATDPYPTMEIATTAEKLGLRTEEAAAVDAAWAIGHQYQGGLWLSDSLKSLYKGVSIPLSFTVNLDDATTFVHTDILPKMATPVPAKVSVNKAEVIITDATPGLEIDDLGLVSQLASAMEATVQDSAPTVIQAPTKDVISPITRATVQPIADRLNSIGDLKLAFTGNDKTVRPSREQILSWFTVTMDAKGALALQVNSDTLTAYLAKTGIANVDTKPAFTTVSRSLAAYALLPGTKGAADPTKAVSIALPVKAAVDAVAGAFTPGKFDGKYIEVNLAEQKMYLINGNTLEKTYTISSGKWTTPTPTGVYSILSKHPRAYSAAYGLYMPWWQNFLNGEYGIHELPEWPNGYKEGEAHLGTPVSHGCVRLGVGSAKEVYDWTSIGTPVYIH